MEAEVERQPKGDEIGAQLEMSGDEVLMAMQYSRRHSSLNSPFQEGENSSLLDIIEDSEAEEPEAKIMMESMSEEVNGALDTLSERERVVLEMYFGIMFGIICGSLWDQFGISLAFAIILGSFGDHY